MKVFIISLVSLVVVTALVFSASFYVIGTMDELTAMANSISTPPESTAEWDNALKTSKEIEKFWSEHSRLICMSVSHTETEMIDLAIDKMLSSAETEDSGNFSAARSELLHHADCLSTSEKLTVDGVM